MIDLVIHIDPRLHAEAKARAKRCGLTLKQWTARLIRAELNKKDPTPPARSRWPAIDDLGVK